MVIIGNGISGITCARHVRKRDRKRKIIVVSSETKHFFSRTALMYIYMGHMKFEHTKPYEDWFWEKNRIELKYAHVERIAITTRHLHFNDGSILQYGQLVLAVGSKSNKFGWPGQDLKGVQGLYSYPDLQLMEKHTENIQHAVVVGGGLIGVEMAEMLHSRGIGVTFLVREKEFWNNILPLEEARMISRHLREHGIDLRLSTELKEILSDEAGRAKSIITNSGELVACQFVGLTVGVSPNIGFLTGSGIETDRGILVDEKLETNVPGIFAIGDCAQYRRPPAGRRSIEPIWYTGRLHGETLAATLTGTPTMYAPGPWFNSAKFFDIEYQTYGDVKPQLAEGEQSFWWEHVKGKIGVHVVFDSTTKHLIGINAFGMRLRHELFDRWLRQNRTVDYVLEHLRDANFDPEFYRQYETEILQQFNREMNTQLSVKSKNWQRILNKIKA
jgi:NAD(P)H-nitrite reductase large subunit